MVSRPRVCRAADIAKGPFMNIYVSQPSTENARTLSVLIERGPVSLNLVDPGVADQIE
jgi:hypothetical protein